MLEEMDLDGMGGSPGPTPQPSTVWSRGAHSHGGHAHGGHAHAGDPEHDADDSDEGTSQLASLAMPLILTCGAFHRGGPLCLGLSPVSVLPFLASLPVLPFCLCGCVCAY